MEYVDVNQIDQYRAPYEIDEHWNLRKQFILAHAETIDKNKLLCLAQAYVNITTLKVE